MILRPVSRSHIAARAAFTLLEVLIVVAILVVLAGVGGVTYMKFLEDAKEDTAFTQIKNLETVAKAVYTRSGSYPQSLAELTQPSADGGQPALEAEAIRDPWGKEYTYDAAGGHNGGRKPDISTTSPTGKVIGNWPGGR